MKSRTSNTRYNCGHTAYYSIVPSIDDVALCLACNQYMTVIASGTNKVIAFCQKGECETPNPNHDCYKTHVFTSKAEAIVWGTHHAHPVTIQDRKVNA